MTSATTITHKLIDEGINARAHFQVWWALRNLALPKYHSTMSDFKHVDFFHAANSGHSVLYMLALAKMFDRDPRVAGIRELKRALRAEGKAKVANQIASELKPFESQICKVLNIRNRTVVHNDHAITSEKVFQINGVTPNQLRTLIDTVCASINSAAGALGVTDRIFESRRHETATLNMLEGLERGVQRRRA